MNPLNWEFMKEPAWRWMLFIIALSFFLAAWKGVVKEMM